MTLDTYAELFDDDLEAVATALDHRAMLTDVAKLLPAAPRDASEDSLRT